MDYQLGKADKFTIDQVTKYFNINKLITLI